MENVKNILFENSVEAKTCRQKLTTYRKLLLLRTENCPEFIITEFAQDKDIDIQYEALTRTTISDVLRDAAHTSNCQFIQAGILTNPICPKDVIEYLVSDGVPCITELAKEVLEARFG